MRAEAPPTTGSTGDDREQARAEGRQRSALVDAAPGVFARPPARGDGMRRPGDAVRLDPARRDGLELFDVVLDGGTDGCRCGLPDGGGPRSYLLILQREGRCTVVRSGEAAALGAADILLLHTGVPARMQVFGRSRQIWLRLPHPPARRLPTIAAIAGTSGIGMALADLVLSVRTIADTLTARELDGVLVAVFDLALAAVSDVHGRGDGHAPGPSRAMRALAPLQETIERWLADPGLCPARVAAAHHVSIRQVHRLFRQGGTSFSGFVRRRRLERCRDDLVDPRFRGLPMTEIALRWGFSDSSHFSRCFRAAFGCTARDFRAGRAPSTP